MRRIVVIAMLLSVSPSPAEAAPGSEDVKVEATIDPGVVELGDSTTFRLKVRVRGDHDIEIDGEPEFGRDFQIVGRKISPRRRWNGKNEVVRTRVLSFRIRALEVGNHTIEPPEVRIGGERFGVAAPNVRVVDDGSGGDPRGPNRERQSPDDGDRGDDSEPAFRLQADVEPARTAYLGQQLTVVYRLLADPHQRGVRSRPPETPEFDDFWLENLTRKLRGQTKMTSIDGRYMRSSVVAAYALFPLETGRITVDPTTIRLKTAGLMGGGRDRTLRSDPIEFEVQPLPEGAPGGFYEGNVGSWEFLVQTDSTAARRGGSVEVRLVADGSGNVGRVRLPTLEGIDGFEVANRTEEVEKEFVGTTLQGRKTVAVTLTPQRTGTLRIPPLEFSSFDPETDEYRTQTSDPVEFDIRRAQFPDSDDDSTTDSGSAGDEPRADRARDREELLRSLAGPIRSPEGAARPLDPAENRSLYLLAAGLPLGGLILLALAPGLSRLYRRFRPQDDALSFPTDAREEFSGIASGDTDGTVSSIHETWRRYLCRVLDLQSARPDSGEIRSALERREVDSAVIDEIVEILTWCEERRFSPKREPGEDELAEIAERSNRTLTRLREALHPDGPGEPGGSNAVAVALACALFALSAASTPASLASDGGREGAPDPSFERAVELHESGDWSRAAETWSQLLRSSNRPAAAARYNLGTALARLDELGDARLQLERAALEHPGRDKIAGNLAVVRRLVDRERVEAARSSGRAQLDAEGIRWWKFFAGLDERPLWLTIVVAAWIAFLAAVSRRLAAGGLVRHLATWTTAAAVAALVGAAGALGAKRAVLAGPGPAVVTAQETPVVRSGPSRHAPRVDVQPPAVPGTMLKVLEKRAEWIHVRNPGVGSARKIWIPNSAVERMSPESG